ncbi:MAG: hypothetical protein LBJ14_10500 [Desulfarculales bacterium]|nr:hypothetical protein [Desulfarculales bacterium]
MHIKISLEGGNFFAAPHKKSRGVFPAAVSVFFKEAFLIHTIAWALRVLEARALPPEKNVPGNMDHEQQLLLIFSFNYAARFYYVKR